MDLKIRKFITGCFYALSFFTPLILYPKTAEIFEFNKIVFIYLTTITIGGFYLIRVIINKKFIFKRSPADIFLILFLISQLISTYYSIDTRTSLFGFYGRFNGGLLSTVSYCLLYWLFVTNVERNQSIKALRLTIVSGVLVGFIAISERFGTSPTCFLVSTSQTPYDGFLTYSQAVFSNFDPACWVQDFSQRAFSTIGQPNWLAAWLVAIIPVSWSLALLSKKDIKKLSNITKSFWLALSLPVLPIAVLFTKSRSGLVALIIAALIFWLTYILKSYFKGISLFKNRLSYFAVILVLFFSSLVLVNLFVKNLGQSSDLDFPQVEISDTFEIRKIVWRGAIDIWKDNRLLGSGPETFGLTYSAYKHIEHNMTTEWNFLFNKAHNEYLNILANSGLIGLITYAGVIVGFYIIFIKNLVTSHTSKNSIDFYLHLGLMLGFTSILITNFVGFSVTVTSLAFFIFPAISYSLTNNSKIKVAQNNKVGVLQLVPLSIIISMTIYSFYNTYLYWHADTLSESAKASLSQGNPVQARELIISAIDITPNEPNYWVTLSEITATLAIDSPNDQGLIKGLVDSSIIEANNAVSLSPANVNLKAHQAHNYIMLTAIDPTFMTKASDVLKTATTYAPNDPELMYNFGLTLTRTNQNDEAINAFQNAIQSKPNYKEPRLALAILQIDKGELTKAKEQLDYIYDFIDKSDATVLLKLKELE